MIADLEVDLRAHRVRRADRAIELTAKEFALLEFLVRHRDQVVDRCGDHRALWDENQDPNTSVLEVARPSAQTKIDDDFDVEADSYPARCGVPLRRMSAEDNSVVPVPRSRCAACGFGSRPGTSEPSSPFCCCSASDYSRRSRVASMVSSMQHRSATQHANSRPGSAPARCRRRTAIELLIDSTRRRSDSRPYICWYSTRWDDRSTVAHRNRGSRNWRERRATSGVASRTHAVHDGAFYAPARARDAAEWSPGRRCGRGQQRSSSRIVMPR